jgi:plastocyanin
MKKIIIFLSFLFLAVNTFATHYTIGITFSSTDNKFYYVPDSLTANVGDTVTIPGSGIHPAVQVSEDTWNANGSTQLSGGWGQVTSNYTFVISSTETIYYVCQHHVSMGMKGKIMVNNPTGIFNNTNTDKINVFPNPVRNGEFTLKMDNYAVDNNTQLMIYNLEGKLVHSQELIGNQNKINTKIASGVYFYVVSNNNKEIYRNKLVVNSAE